MKKSNKARSTAGQKRYRKNKARKSDKVSLSKQERFEKRERAKILGIV